MIDCGATAHIIKDRAKFIELDPDFNASQHTIELADSSRKPGMVLGRGKARVNMTNTSADVCNIILDNALFIPSYSQNILSVSEVTKKGVRVIFSKNNAVLITPTGVKFKIEQKGKLYYINTVMGLEVEGSTTSQLLEHIQKIVHILEEDFTAYFVYLDLAKAFDKVDMNLF